MTRKLALELALLALVGWLAYQTWPAQWQERAADRAAISRCNDDIRLSEHLSVDALNQRHEKCKAMEVAFNKKW